MPNIIISIFVFLLLLGIIVALLIEFVFKKYKCKEGSCERVIGGDFRKKEDCENKCKKP